MNGARQPTRLSPTTKRVVGASVIEFHDRPRYRGCEVDLTHSRFAEYLGPASKGGNIQPGARVSVPHVKQPTGSCALIVEAVRYTIHPAFDGLVSVGVEDA